MNTRYRNALLIGSIVHLAAMTAPAAESPASSATSKDPVVSKLAAPMMAVTQLVVVEKLNPLIDRLIQNAPPAARLGDRWNPSSAAWQQARTSISGRIDRIVDLYRNSGDLGRALETKVQGLDPASQAAFAAVLNGPAGPTIVRDIARMEFTLAMMSEDPEAPSPGDSRWQPRLRELNDTFDRRIGSAVPARDARYAADAEKFFANMSSDVSLVTFSTVSYAVGQIEHAINLVLFDDSDAIRREIEAVIASVK